MIFMANNNLSKIDYLKCRLREGFTRKIENFCYIHNTLPVKNYSYAILLTLKCFGESSQMKQRIVSYKLQKYIDFTS
jgi:hypothetical protein